MSCNCDSCLEHVDCECPTLTGVTGSTAVAYVTTVYTPAQSIAGAGYDLVLYTNSSAVSETVLVETNLYLIGTDTGSVTTSTYLRSAVPLSGAAIMIKETTPVKTDHTHFLPPTTLTAGQNISITITGTLGAPTLKILKAIVYKY